MNLNIIFIFLITYTYKILSQKIPRHPCSTTYGEFFHNNFCYHQSNQSGSWLDINNIYCSDHYNNQHGIVNKGYLCSIHSDEENNIITNNVFQSQSWLWFGAQRVAQSGPWKTTFSDGTALGPYTNWGATEEGIDECGEMRSSGDWGDWKCDQSAQQIGCCKYPIISCHGELSYEGNMANVCSGKGYCWETDICACYVGYTGNVCDEFMCYGIVSSNQDVCSGFGTCYDINSCNCSSDEYYGSNCELWECYGVQNNESNVCGDLKGECVDHDDCKCDQSECKTELENCVHGKECREMLLKAELVSGNKLQIEWIAFYDDIISHPKVMEILDNKIIFGCEDLIKSIDLIGSSYSCYFNLSSVNLDSTVMVVNLDSDDHQIVDQSIISLYMLTQPNFDSYILSAVLYVEDVRVKPSYVVYIVLGISGFFVILIAVFIIILVLCLIIRRRKRKKGEDFKELKDVEGKSPSVVKKRNKLASGLFNQQVFTGIKHHSKKVKKIKRKELKIEDENKKPIESNKLYIIKSAQMANSFTVVNYKEFLSVEKVKEIEKLFKTASTVKHENLLDYVCYCIDKKKIALISETFAENLIGYFHKRKEKKVITHFKEKCSILKSIVFGLNALHSKEIYHGGLSFESIKFKMSGDSSNLMIDYGYHQPLVEKEDMISSFFTAPELLNSSLIEGELEAPMDVEDRIEFKRDIFALGMIMYLILVEDLTEDEFFKQENLGQKMSQDPSLRPTLGKKAKYFPNYYVNVMNMCLNENPDRRPSSKRIIEILKSVAETAK